MSLTHAFPACLQVVYNGRMVKVPCAPGELGAELFKQQVREIFGLDESTCIDVTFELKVRSSPEDSHGEQGRRRDRRLPFFLGLTSSR